MLSFLRKNLKSILSCLAILTLAVCADICVLTTEVPRIIVSPDYPNEVFSALCTVAVLGNAVLSLLFGASEKIIRGIPFQDILQHSSFGRNQQFAIIATTASIPLAMLAYAYSMCTSLTMLVVLNVYLILSSSISLWKLFSDDAAQAAAVDEILAHALPERFETYVDNWFQDLERSLSSSSETTVKEFCALLRAISTPTLEDTHPINISIARHLPGLFRSACEKQGFVEAYRMLTQINSIRPYGFTDREFIALDYLKEVQYQDTVNIHNRSIQAVSEAIIEKMEISDWEKRSLVYRYFCAVFDNPYLASDIKTEYLASLMDYLCHLRDEPCSSLKKDVLMLIVRLDVLYNENTVTREHIFSVLIEELVKHNHYINTDPFVAVISEIFRALYMIAFYETETLTANYRQKLLPLYHLCRTEKDLVKPTLALLISHNKHAVCIRLAEDAAVFGRDRQLFWDYFPRTTGVKSIIWSQEHLIRFAFCFYKFIGYCRGGNPFVKILQSGNYSNQEKEMICRVITSLYTSDGLGPQALDMIAKLETLTGKQGMQSKYFEPEEYSFFQDQLSELITNRNQDAGDPDTLTSAAIIEKLQQEFDAGSVFRLNPALPLGRKKYVRLPPFLVEQSHKSPQETVHRINDLICTALNGIISRKLGHVSVNFSEEGIRKLLDKLEGETYQYRNYTYVNDLGISPAVKNTDEFQKLCSILQTIPCDPGQKIRPYVFLKEPTIQFNLDLHYRLSEPSEAACAGFVLRHQTAEGTYQIGASRFDHSHAMRHVMNNYRQEFIELWVHADISEDSGFQIDFE